MYIDRLVNHHLRLGYDIGKGFLTGEEDMMQQFGRLALTDEEQTQELKQHSDYTRMEVIKSLGKITGHRREFYSSLMPSLIYFRNYCFRPGATQPS